MYMYQMIFFFTWFTDVNMSLKAIEKKKSDNLYMFEVHNITSFKHNFITLFGLVYYTYWTFSSNCLVNFKVTLSATCSA